MGYCCETRASSCLLELLLAAVCRNGISSCLLEHLLYWRLFLEHDLTAVCWLFDSCLLILCSSCSVTSTAVLMSVIILATVGWRVISSSNFVDVVAKPLRRHTVKGTMSRKRWDFIIWVVTLGLSNGTNKYIYLHFSNFCPMWQSYFLSSFRSITLLLIGHICSAEWAMQFGVRQWAPAYDSNRCATSHIPSPRYANVRSADCLSLTLLQSGLSGLSLCMLHKRYG